jgi:DNA-directed RNA polymerase subunit alpha
LIENNWITLVKPNKVDYKISENKKFGTVVIEPLEKGFGTTLGNALRRVLLSSLQGTAITSIKINGVLHEFSTIEGVREDVTDIIMNLKNVTFNSKSNHTQKLTLNVKAETGPATGVFVTYDESDVSTLATPADTVANRSLRGTTTKLPRN